MAYQATNATNMADLINKVATFATANGWTAHRNTLTGSDRVLALRKTGDYIHIWNSGADDMYIRASVGYDGGQPPSSQPNQSASVARVNCGGGPFSNVFFFSNNDSIFAVVEIASGIFRHLCFGVVQKYGAFTGGTFFEGMFYSGLSGFGHADNPLSSYHHIPFSNDSYYCADRGGVRCDLDGNTNYFAPFSGPDLYVTPTASGGMGANSPPSTGSEYGNRVNEGFYDRSINAWSGLTPIQPVKVRAERGSNYWSEIGQVPAMRFANIARFQPGDEFTIGADTWKIFPWVRKGFVSAEQYSLDYAFAYLKTV